MTFAFFILSIIIAAIASSKFNSRADILRVYSSFVIALLLTLLWYAPQIFTENMIYLRWKILDPLFYSIFFTFPIIFLLVLFIMITALHSRKLKTRSKRVNRLIPFLFIFTAVFLLLIGIDAKLIEPNWIDVSYTNINTKKWHGNSIPLKIVQLSDLHIEKLGYREKAALEIIDNLKPDIILLTGDYINLTEKGQEAALAKKFMDSLEAPYGVYAVSGNWDNKSVLKELTRGNNVTLMDGDAISISTKSGAIRLSGISWDEVLRDKPNFPHGVIGSADEFNILLTHMPYITHKAPKGLDLILAGHTHGGQVRIPFMKYVIEGTRLEQKQLQGMTRLENGELLYINRGLGMQGEDTPRIRFRCRPEISVFNIK